MAWLLAAYGAASAFLWTFQRSIIYPAPKERREPSLPGADLVRLMGSGGRTVHCFRVRVPGDGPTIVHFHGNGESLADVVDLAATFRDLGIGFFAVEYPGYGLSNDASPSEQAIYEDAETALGHLRDALGVSRERTVIEGQSLGTGVAVEMARRGYGSRLVLISPYTSMIDMARRVVPFLPAQFLMRDRFDNAEKVGSLTIPALVVHGTRDEIIPFSMGERLASRLPQARFRPISGAHHNDVWQHASLAVEIAAFARGES